MTKTLEIVLAALAAASDARIVAARAAYDAAHDDAGTALLLDAYQTAFDAYLAAANAAFNAYDAFVTGDPDETKAAA